MVGTTHVEDNRTRIVEYETNPFTGETITKKLHLKTRTNRQGETVLRESLD